MSSSPPTRLPNPIRPAFEQGSTPGSVIVNIGPSHPATHGTIQIVAELSGERVIRTVSPACMKGVLGWPSRMVSIMRISAMHE